MTDKQPTQKDLLLEHDCRIAALENAVDTQRDTIKLLVQVLGLLATAENNRNKSDSLTNQ